MGTVTMFEREKEQKLKFRKGQKGESKEQIKWVGTKGNINIKNASVSQDVFTATDMGYDM